MPRAALDAMEPDGGFAKRHLLNSVVLRMLGDLRGRRVLDAGCGQGYFSRMLADRGAEVVGVEPGLSLITYAIEQEAQRRQRALAPGGVFVFSIVHPCFEQLAP